ncbi:Fructosamine kinase-domain-containing protein [Xylogone sp. PMI_703]|nr:Fructosamine kinase-domain-containing protein [Xylogone sp. PMI_703]
MSEVVHDLLDEPSDGTTSATGDFSLDYNVVEKFPKGARILSANRFGTSAWTVTARIAVALPDGAEKQYFLKCATGEEGRVMMEGEFNAMSELYKTMPLFVPEPHSCGKYRDGSPETYFFLSQYIEMENRLPEPNQLCRKLAQLHKKSVSPTGKFGFHVTTCQGRIPQAVAWESSWTVFFTKLLRHVASLDFETNGHWEELDILEKRIFSDVIPTLIGNLERDGRTVKPSLIHADLWEGNTGTSTETGEIFLFDSGAFYAHSEMEIGDWRCHYNKIHNKIYTKTYRRHYQKVSEPKEEWDDRNRMYSIYYNVIYSVNHMAEGKAVRQTAYDDMYYLIDKYAPFTKGEGPSRLEESDRAVLSEERDHTVS